MMGEFEEGEFCHYKTEDDVDIDPDIALSYIDEKIQDVLGHFQKDFEGGVSAENLGAKFGGYGSFLPVYQRSPPILFQPKTPQKFHSMTGSPNDHAAEGAIQTSEAPSNTLPTTKVGPPFCSAQTSQNLRVSSGGIPSRTEKCSSSSQVPEILKKTVYPDHNRNLKVRLKVGSKNVVMKNTEIYSGLGLDDSPCSSPEDNPQESGGKLFHSQESPGESPASILQIMTSFPLPGGLLLSPLQDSMLCLVKKENLPKNSTIVPSCMVDQEHPGQPMDESATTQVNCELKREKKTKLGRNGDKSIDLKHEHGTDSENDKTYVLKREVDSEAKDLASSITPPPRIGVGVNGTKGSHGAVKISRKTDAERLKDRLFSPDLASEDSLESISAQECGRSEKQHVKSSTFQKKSEGRVSKSIGDVSVCIEKFGRDKTGIKHAFDSGLTLSKHKEDINSSAVNPLQETFPRRATLSGPGKVKKPLKSAKVLSEGKRKSVGTENAHEPVVEVAKETLRDGSCTVSTDKKTHISGIHTSKGKLKLTKEIGMVTHNKTDVFREAKFGQGDKETYHLNRSSCDGPKGIKTVNPEKRLHSLGDNIKERPSCKENGYKTASETLLKENRIGASHITQNELPSGMASTAAAHVIIEEDWVCCDRCQKWRLLPYGTKPEQLPEKWLCSMLNWLPGMNRCDISEEETTRALHALYLLPVPDSQTNLLDNGNRTETGVRTADGQHLDQNHYGKKKDKSKDLQNFCGNGSVHIINSQKYHRQDSLKWTKMKGMNQPSDSNLMNEPSFQNPSGSQCFNTEKITKKLKNIPTKEGKTKNKREGDQCGDGPSKKIKTDGMHNSYIYGDGDQAGGIGRVGLSTKMQRNDEHGYTKDGEFNAKRGLVISVRKPRDQAQILNGEGSLALKECHKEGIIIKKQKLKGGQVDVDNLEAIRTSSCNLSDSKVHAKEENNEQFKEDKGRLVYKFDVRESTRSKEDDGSTKKDEVPHIRLSGSRDKWNDSMEGLNSTDEDQKPTNHREHILSQQSLNAADITKRDSGNGQFSTAATSSSSKVSGSCKTRSNFQDLIGSPVESVSSSPLRASNPDGLTSLRRRIASKDHSPRRSLGEKYNANCQSGTSRKGKDHSVHSTNSGSSHLDHDQRILNPVDQKYEEDILSKDHNIHSRMSPWTHGNGSSLHCRSKDQSSVKNSDKDTTAHFNPLSEQELNPLKSLRHEPEIDPHHLALTNEDVSNVKHQFRDGGNKYNKDDKYLVSKTDSRRKCSSDIKKNNIPNFEEHNNQDMKWGTPYATNGKASLQQNLVRQSKYEKPSNSSNVEKDLIQKDGKKRKTQIDQGHGGTSVTLTENLQSVSKTQRDMCSFLPDDAAGKDGRLLEQHGTAVNENGSHCASRNVLLSQDAVAETNNPSTTKESSSQTATDVLNLAKNLRDYADRLKNSGFSFESNEVYFQAALEFLYGTSLLEASGNEIARHGEMNHMQTYGSTAKLCESCAHEYDRRKEMASATLAYKCMEVAYMRVVYYKHSSSSRDSQELQSILQKIPPGESPSSSVSDVDNLNNQGMVDKAAFSKGIGGNNHLVAKNRPSFLRLLDFTQDIISAMEATSRSQNAFAAATISLEEAHNTEGIISLKRVIDFSFQDVEGLVRLVRLAKEAISRSVQ